MPGKLKENENIVFKGWPNKDLRTINFQSRLKTYISDKKAQIKGIEKDGKYFFTREEQRKEKVWVNLIRLKSKTIRGISISGSDALLDDSDSFSARAVAQIKNKESYIREKKLSHCAELWE